MFLVNHPEPPLLISSVAEIYKVPLLVNGSAPARKKIRLDTSSNAEASQPAVAYATESRSIVLQNGSSSQVLSFGGSGEHMAFDPVRRVIILYDYHCDQRAGLKLTDVNCIRALHQVTLTGDTSTTGFGPQIDHGVGKKERRRAHKL